MIIKNHNNNNFNKIIYTIKKYSPSHLKYEKKITITYDKKQYYFRISDIHYEIDMSLLGCNSKLLWHEIYQQIVDIISAKTEKSGIIVCKNFHEIHNELLENCNFNNLLLLILKK
jgi:YbbR domain-containing protein